jgi:hypothetical protein
MSTIIAITIMPTTNYINIAVYNNNLCNIKKRNMLTDGGCWTWQRIARHELQYPFYVHCTISQWITSSTSLLDVPSRELFGSRCCLGSNPQLGHLLQMKTSRIGG